jgi:hypothetical protein
MCRRHTFALLLALWIAASAAAPAWAGTIPCNDSSGSCNGKNVGDSCGAEGTGTCEEYGLSVVSTTCACQASGGLPVPSASGPLRAILAVLLGAVAVASLRARRAR